jgi:hypothetical protein
MNIYNFTLLLLSKKQKSYILLILLIILAFSLLIILAFSLNSGRINSPTINLVSDSFDKGYSGNWNTYNWELVNGFANSVFYPASSENQEGVDNTGFIWTDDSRWGVDMPDSYSILPFIFYSPIQFDLRNALLSVYLRGTDLDLKGGECYFWILNNQKGTRYYYSSNPLKISESGWGKRLSFILKNKKNLWSRTWSRFPNNPGTLNDTLSKVDSYGFSFRGFAEPVTGRLEMDEFSIISALSSIRSKNKWKYINKRGKVKIQLQNCEYAGNFSDGLAEILVNSGIELASTIKRAYGYIDKTRNFIIQPQFDYAGTFSEGLAPVKTEGKWAYIDKTRNFIIQPQFDYAGTFSEGLAPVKTKGKWAYIDKIGNVIIQTKCVRIGTFSEGLACVLN